MRILKRIPSTIYGFYEVEGDLNDIKSGDFAKAVEHCENSAKEDRRGEAKDRKDCGHFYTAKETGTKKDGSRWVKEVCLSSNCGAIRWQNPDGSFSPWSYPIR